MSKQQYDLVIIGAGAGGLIAADLLCSSGQKWRLSKRIASEEIAPGPAACPAKPF